MNTLTALQTRHANLVTEADQRQRARLGDLRGGLVRVWAPTVTPPRHDRHRDRRPDPRGHAAPDAACKRAIRSRLGVQRSLRE